MNVFNRAWIRLRRLSLSTAVVAAGSAAVACQSDLPRATIDGNSLVPRVLYEFEVPAPHGEGLTLNIGGIVIVNDWAYWTMEDFINLNDEPETSASMEADDETAFDFVVRVMGANLRISDAAVEFPVAYVKGRRTATVVIDGDKVTVPSKRNLAESILRSRDAYPDVAHIEQAVIDDRVESPAGDIWMAVHNPFFTLDSNNKVHSIGRINEATVVRLRGGQTESWEPVIAVETESGPEITFEAIAVADHGLVVAQLRHDPKERTVHRSVLYYAFP